MLQIRVFPHLESQYATVQQDYSHIFNVPAIGKSTQITGYQRHISEFKISSELLQKRLLFQNKETVFFQVPQYAVIIIFLILLLYCNFSHLFCSQPQFQLERFTLSLVFTDLKCTVLKKFFFLSGINKFSFNGLSPLVLKKNKQHP